MARDSSASSSRSAPAASPRPAGWQGGRGEDAARHRWQQGNSASAGAPSLALWRSRRLRLLLWSLLAGGLISLLLYYLLFTPAQTPFISVATSNYAWPLPPNAWTREDLDHLQQLDAKTIRLVDGSVAWSSREEGLKHLATQLQLLKRHPARASAVVIYVSLHGVVDGAGQPCLLPADALPLETETWLPLATLLAHIKDQELPRDVHTLLILDCARQHANWDIGLLHNTFADELPRVVEAAGMTNLAVLAAAGPGETACTAPELHASVFGHYFHLGLAGAADQWTNGGNGNQRVSLLELAHYTQIKVGEWTRHHRGVTQRPMLVSTSGRDFDVTWAVSRRTLRTMQAQAQHHERAAPLVSSTRLARLWTGHDRLKKHEPERLSPLAWRDFERRLLWLEQASESGQGYADSSTALLDELSSWLDKVEARLSDPSAERSVASLGGYLVPPETSPLSTLSIHSLPLAQFFGATGSAEVRPAIAAWQQLEQSPSEKTLAEALQALAQASPGTRLQEAQYLQFLSRYHSLDLWKESLATGQGAELQRLAAELGVPRTDNGILGDERAHAWIRGELDSADSIRRATEDKFWQGQDVANLPAAELWSPAREAYSAVADKMRQTSQLYALRDRSWMEVRSLAGWLTRPQQDAALSAAADEEIRKTLLPLIARLNGLEARLEQGAGNSGEIPDAAAEATLPSTEIAEGLAQLHSRFQQSAQDLLKSPNQNAAAIVELESVLAAPLLPWELRDQLKTKYLEIAAELESTFAAASGQKPDSVEQLAPSAESPDGRELRRMSAQWPEHPLVAMLSRIPLPTSANKAEPLGAPAADEVRLANKVAQQGAQVRRQLELLGTAGGIPQPVLKANQEEAPRLEELTPQEARRAESLARCASGLWCPAPPEDPFLRLRGADLQQLLIWQARRSLNDFWGSAGKPEEPFFAIAAADYLAGARLVHPASPVVAEEIQTLETLLAERAGAARSALAVAVSDILLPDSATSVPMKGTVSIAAAAIPPGTGVAFLADQQGRVPGATLPLPLSDKEKARVAPWEYNLESQSLATRGPLLEATALFRGHEFSAPLLLRVPGGYRVSVIPPRYGPPRVTLSGERSKRPSVVFILDCSYSMKELVDVESPVVDDAPRIPRLDAAKGALRSLLEQFAEQGDTRVGVRFYGHRVGWSTAEEGKLLRQGRYGGEIPPDLQPYADVELVLPLGRFDTVSAGKVNERMRTVEPWGESPLYLALSQALGDFRGDDDETQRSIVVITDGVNNQFNPPASHARTLDDVLSAAAGRKVPIHVVGFGIPKDQQEAARADFGKLTETTGGQFFPATNASALTRSLESLLGEATYRLLDAGGKEIAQSPVGRAVELGGVPPSPRKFSVALENSRLEIELAGGEALELVAGRAIGRIESAAYLKGNPKFAPLRGDSSVLQVGAHTPVRQDQGILFGISFQHAHRGFAARPGEVWMEVTPIIPGASGAATKYIFYDSPYLPERPVPVLECLAEGWPQAARRGEIRVWCKPTMTEPTMVVPLAKVANQPPPGAGGYVIEEVPGVTFQARTFYAPDAEGRLRVGIVERYPAEGLDVDQVKVEMFPPAQQILRQFDAANRVVLHTFLYEGLTPAQMDNLEIRFTSREALQAGAWELGEPIVVDVASRSDLLELSPPANGKK